MCGSGRRSKLTVVVRCIANRSIMHIYILFEHLTEGSCRSQPWCGLSYIEEEQ